MAGGAVLGGAVGAGVVEGVAWPVVDVAAGAVVAVGRVVETFGMSVVEPVAGRLVVGPGAPATTGMEADVVDVAPTGWLPARTTTQMLPTPLPFVSPGWRSLA